MKKILLIFSLILSLCAGYSHAQDRHDTHRGHEVYERHGHHDRSPYLVSNNKVFYEGREIKGASAKKFEILHDGYAKDTWNVYYRGEELKGANSHSFKVLGYGYAKDTWNVYYNGRKIENANAHSFTVLSDWYAKDTWNVFYDGEKIDDAKSHSFKVLHDGYAKDTWNIYLTEERSKELNREALRCFITATPRTHGTRIISERKSIKIFCHSCSL